MAGLPDECQGAANVAASLALDLGFMLLRVRPFQIGAVP